MSNWMKKQFYCDVKGKWHNCWHIREGDPRIKPGTGCKAGSGEVLIDTDTLTDYCTACKKTWPAEELVFHCDCGQVHKVNYSDSAVVIQAESGVIATDGRYGYAVTQTDIDVTGQRRYHNIGAKK